MAATRRGDPRTRRAPGEVGGRVGRGFAALVGVVWLVTGCQTPGTETDLFARPPQPLPPDCSPSVGGTSPVVYAVLVIDSSTSAAMEPTGLDVDGDGIVSVVENGADPLDVAYPTDFGDGSLALQISAARSVVSEIASDRHRFALVYLGGQDARVASGFSSDPRWLERALRQVYLAEEFGPDSNTAALDRAFRMHESEDAPGARRLVLLVTTSGDPFPGIFDDWSDAVERARTPAQVYSFALGPNALQDTRALRAVAAATNGRFFAVPRFEDLACTLARSLGSDPEAP